MPLEKDLDRRDFNKLLLYAGAGLVTGGFGMSAEAGEICEPKRTRLKGVKVLPRKRWKAKPPNMEILGSMENCSNHPIEKVVIHHTGSPRITTSKNERSRLREAQRWHQNEPGPDLDKRKGRGWGDLAYHYAVGPSGNIYEGRNPAFRGDSGKLYYPDEDRSHTPEGHLLVVALGNFNREELTPEAETSLVRIVVANLLEYSLPADSAIMHRDLAHTNCPGENIANWLAQKGRAQIVELLAKRK